MILNDIFNSNHPMSRMEQYILLNQVPNPFEWFQDKMLHANCDSDIRFVADQHGKSVSSI